MGAKKKGGNKPPADEKSGSQESGKLKGGQKIEVRHILCSKHAQKEAALAELKADGEDVSWSKFVEVAKKYSEDKASKGGLIGTMTKGSLLPAFEAVAYDLPPTQTDARGGKTKVFIGEAKTEEGYHLIVVDKRL
ncbi:FKBP-like protein [Xylariaceae sp. FL1019]|nr:FKBP-like protein [Xylariaceae sp. FL1019]